MCRNVEGENLQAVSNVDISKTIFPTKVVG